MFPGSKAPFTDILNDMIHDARHKIAPARGKSVCGDPGLSPILVLRTVVFIIYDPGISFIFANNYSHISDFLFTNICYNDHPCRNQIDNFWPICGIHKRLWWIMDWNVLSLYLAFPGGSRLGSIRLLSICKHSASPLRKFRFISCLTLRVMLFSGRRFVVLAVFFPVWNRTSLMECWRFGKNDRSY